MSETKPDFGSAFVRGCAQVLDAEDEIWETILGKIGMVVKTQLEVFDRIQMKANDPVLEPLLAANPGD